MRVVLTYADYVALPNDGKRYEILDGELSVTPAPGIDHQRIVGALFVALHLHVTAHRLGEVFVAPCDVILAETAIVQPDIVFLANDRAGIVTRRGVEGAPTLAVEVLSGSTERADRNTKLQLYARYAVPYYWIVDPTVRAIEVHQLADDAYGAPDRFSGDDLVDPPPFPGLRLDPATLWPSDNHAV